jgi:hypothetical protein
VNENDSYQPRDVFFVLNFLGDYTYVCIVFLLVAKMIITSMLIIITKGIISVSFGYPSKTQYFSAAETNINEVYCFLCKDYVFDEDFDRIISSERKQALILKHKLTG